MGGAEHVARVWWSNFEVEQMSERHELNCDRIEEADEINGDDQLVWIWCGTHRRFEWHSVPVENVRGGGKWVSTRKPVQW